MTVPMNPDDSVTPELSCGRDPLDVVDRADHGASTAHELTCEYCQGVIAGHGAAAAAVEALSADERAAAVPATLLPGVMRTVWAELRRSSMIAVPARDPGTSVFIAEHAVASLVERDLDAVPQLRLLTLTVQPAPAPPHVDVRLTACVAFRSDVEELADTARSRVRSVLGNQLGWDVGRVDVEVEDVFVPQEQQR